MVPLWAQPKLRPLPRHCTQQFLLGHFEEIGIQDHTFNLEGPTLVDGMDNKSHIVMCQNSILKKALSKNIIKQHPFSMRNTIHPSS